MSEAPDTKYVCLMRDEDQYHCTIDSSFCEEDTQVVPGSSHMYNLVGWFGLFALPLCLFRVV